MAVVIQCDRCGKIGGPAGFTHIFVHGYISVTTYNKLVKEDLDICQCCHDELFAFANEENKQEGEEE